MNKPAKQWLVLGRPMRHLKTIHKEFERMRLFAGLVCTALISGAAFAHEPERTDAEVKDLVLEAIRENPEIVLEAVAILEQRERDQQAANAAMVLADLETSQDAPVFGNSEGDVTIVEFFDYNCGFCRRSGPVMQGILNTDTNVKVVMREWPILGEESVFAARAALAARKQGKYEEFHWGLMMGGARASEATVRNLAVELGMDVDQLLSDMNGADVDAHLAESNRIARALGFNGTPAFVVGDQVNPGFVEKDQMLSMIEAAREG